MPGQDAAQLAMWSIRPRPRRLTRTTWSRRHPGEGNDVGAWPRGS